MPHQQMSLHLAHRIQQNTYRDQHARSTKELRHIRIDIEHVSKELRDQSNQRQEIWLAAVLIPLALGLPVGGVGKALMIASVLLVLIVELLNSAVEAVVDRVSLEKHELAKRAKDAGSAAVLVALVNVVMVWALVLLG